MIPFRGEEEEREREEKIYNSVKYSCFEMKKKLEVDWNLFKTVEVFLIYNIYYYFYLFIYFLGLDHFPSFG